MTQVIQIYCFLTCMDCAIIERKVAEEILITLFYKQAFLYDTMIHDEKGYIIVAICEMVVIAADAIHIT